MREKTVVSMEEFASKVAAARAAIGEADFFLIARTDARGTSAKHGLAEAITRGNLSVEAGADAALVEGPRSTYELQTIAQNAAGYIAVSISEGGLTPAHTYQQLKEMGFHLVRPWRACLLL
jgi:2-methylisocitrate lyase-like PEP mutase family enzyme